MSALPPDLSSSRIPSTPIPSGRKETSQKEKVGEVDAKVIRVSNQQFLDALRKNHQVAANREDAFKKIDQEGSPNFLVWESKTQPGNLAMLIRGQTTPALFVSNEDWRKESQIRVDNQHFLDDLRKNHQVADNREDAFKRNNQEGSPNFLVWESKTQPGNLAMLARGLTTPRILRPNEDWRVTSQTILNTAYLNFLRSQNQVVRSLAEASKRFEEEPLLTFVIRESSNENLYVLSRNAEREIRLLPGEDWQKIISQRLRSEAERGKSGS